MENSFGNVKVNGASETIEGNGLRPDVVHRGVRSAALLCRAACRRLVRSEVRGEKMVLRLQNGVTN